jgi:hypothetical protein
MKILLLLAGLLAFSLSALQAQDAAVEAPAASPPRVFSPADLETLVGQIALYPDALIALILPAATFPTDLVLAARHLRERGNDLSMIEQQPWDDSVKSLARYPDVLRWMDENLIWTKQLGETFLRDPASVMNAVQRLRTKARAKGALVDTPQQQVVADAGVIRIVPAQPQVIYVPYYQPDVVFSSRPIFRGRTYFSFSVGYPVGS